MEPNCFASTEFCAARVAALHLNGLPQNGLHGYATTATVTATPGVDIEKGAETTKKNGCGRTCQTKKNDDEVKRATIDIALCELDIQFAFLAAGGQLFADLDAVPLGYQVPVIGDPAPNGVCLELWSKAWDGDEQATPTALGNLPAFWHWVFPKTKLTLSNQKLDDGFLDFTLSGFSDANSNMSASGPFDDWPDFIVDGGGITSSYGLFLDTNIPTETCELIVVAGGS